MTFPIKEMIYSGITSQEYDLPEILAGDDFEDNPNNPYKYLVVNHAGSHPCCYVGIPKGGKAINLNNICCHGGITWTGPGLPQLIKNITPKEFFKDVWWIGWDYAHWNDYIAPSYFSSGKKWTTVELIDDCKRVIEQLEKDN